MLSKKNQIDRFASDIIITSSSPSSPDTATALSPPAFTPGPPTLGRCYEDSLESLGESQGVPIALASGELSVRVKIRQSDAVQGPKLEVEGFLGSIHLLLSPQQLQILIEMVNGIASQGEWLFVLVL